MAGQLGQIWIGTSNTVVPDYLKHTGHAQLVYFRFHGPKGVIKTPADDEVSKFVLDTLNTSVNKVW
jgi:hypothetical protein